MSKNMKEMLFVNTYNAAVLGFSMMNFEATLTALALGTAIVLNVIKIFKTVMDKEEPKDESKEEKKKCKGKKCDGNE